MSENNMNEIFEETMVDATVITVPIDATLTHSNEAADAKAVGDALDLKADRSEVVTIDVNGSQADLQGHIELDAGDIPVVSGEEKTVAQALAETGTKTAADIPMSGTDPTTVKTAIEDAQARYATNIPMSDSEGAEMISAKIAEMDAEDATLANRIDNHQVQLNGKVPYTGKRSSYNSQNQSNYDIENGTRHIIALISNSTVSNGLFLVNCNANNGVITAATVYKGDNITLNVETPNKFRYIVGSQVTVRLYDLDVTDAFVDPEV